MPDSQTARPRSLVFYGSGTQPCNPWQTVAQTDHEPHSHRP